LYNEMKIYTDATPEELLKSGKYFIALYHIKGKSDMQTMAENIALGQSIGNPNVRNDWETDELVENHSCLILKRDPKEYQKQYIPMPENFDFSYFKNEGLINIAFPMANINFREDGISQLLCQVMGGQMDIDMFEKCHLLKLTFPENIDSQKPKYGISGLRKFTGKYDKPLLGGIIKPKTGLNKHRLLDMVKQMVSGGVDFIKEDEIMANPAVCPFEERVALISDYIQNCGQKVVYSFCINSDPLYVLKRADFVAENGGNGVHINVWSGLGVYNSIRRMDLPLFIHYQKSGDKVFTNKNHDFHIDWEVICTLAGMSGVDTIHSGMIGGYSGDSEYNVRKYVELLRKDNVMPALSCGMHPGLIDKVTDAVGNDYMANVGGAIHGHPDGSYAGAAAMRQAIDKNYGNAFALAIKKWGFK
jgi:ribulose-bisphosphate carboxylase large chain